MRTSLFAGLALLCLAPVSADAQVQDYLLTYIEENFTDYSYATDFLDGSLNEGDEDEWTVTLDSGSPFIAVAACDEDCGDLDMQVRINGRLVGEDVYADDFPFVQFTSGSSGQVRISVIMVTCSLEPCYYSMRVLG